MCTVVIKVTEKLFDGDDELFQLSKLFVGAGIDTYLNLASMNGVFCFVEGTLVLSSEGHVPIEDIVVGDLVWAEETTTGEKNLKKVVNTFVNETSELVHVYVNGEEIVSTPNHPFYSHVRGWVEAINLRAGDILVLQNGAYVVVEFIQHEILEATIKVYNFEVEDYHTYYVGENSILVHNSCERMGKQKGNAPRSNQAQNKQFNDIIKSYGLNKKEARMLHDVITDQGYSRIQIIEELKALFPNKKG